MKHKRLLTTLGILALLIIPLSQLDLSKVFAQCLSYDGFSCDHDNDGVLDQDDQCVTEPGPASNNGCPYDDDDEEDVDSDGDGLLNPDDGCPSVAGPADNNGCPYDDGGDDGGSDDGGDNGDDGGGDDGGGNGSDDGGDDGGSDDGGDNDNGGGNNNGGGGNNNNDDDDDGDTDLDDDSEDDTDDAVFIGPIFDPSFIENDGFNFVSSAFDWLIGGWFTDDVQQEQDDPPTTPTNENECDTYACDSDSDGDRLSDNVDLCPNEDGPLNTGGCPEGSPVITDLTDEQIYYVAQASYSESSGTDSMATTMGVVLTQNNWSENSDDGSFYGFSATQHYLNANLDTYSTTDAINEQCRQLQNVTQDQINQCLNPQNAADQALRDRAADQAQYDAYNVYVENFGEFPLPSDQRFNDTVTLIVAIEISDNGDGELEDFDYDYFGISEGEAAALDVIMNTQSITQENGFRSNVLDVIPNWSSSMTPIWYNNEDEEVSGVYTFDENVNETIVTQTVVIIRGGENDYDGDGYDDGSSIVFYSGGGSPLHVNFQCDQTAILDGSGGTASAVWAMGNDPNYCVACQRGTGEFSGNVLTSCVAPVNPEIDAALGIDDGATSRCYNFSNGQVGTLATCPEDD